MIILSGLVKDVWVPAPASFLIPMAGKVHVAFQAPTAENFHGDHPEVVAKYPAIEYQGIRHTEWLEPNETFGTALKKAAAELLRCAGEPSDAVLYRQFLYFILTNTLEGGCVMVDEAWTPADCFAIQGTPMAEVSPVVNVFVRPIFRVEFIDGLTDFRHLAAVSSAALSRARS